MRVPGADAETMIKHHQAPVPGMVFSDGHNTIRRCVNRRAVIGSYVNARVKRTFTVERIKPFAEAVRDMSHHWPDRWRIRGIGKIHYWHQLHAAGRDSNDCRVPLEKGVLLNGSVEGVFRSDLAVGRIEGRGVIAEHAVRHGHFGG